MRDTLGILEYAATMDAYDRDGKAISWPEYVQRLGQEHYRVLAQEPIVLPSGRRVVVSTIWLGVMHGRDAQGRPQIFETMTVVESMLDSKIRRYATEGEAQAGHAEEVAHWAGRLEIERGQDTENGSK